MFQNSFCWKTVLVAWTKATQFIVLVRLWFSETHVGSPVWTTYYWDHSLVITSLCFTNDTRDVNQF